MGRLTAYSVSSTCPRTSGKPQSSYRYSLPGARPWCGRSPAPRRRGRATRSPSRRSDVYVHRRSKCRDFEPLVMKASRCPAEHSALPEAGELFRVRGNLRPRILELPLDFGQLARTWPVRRSRRRRSAADPSRGGAVNLHRLGLETREVGMELFEELLEIDAFEARQTRDEIDNRLRDQRSRRRPRPPTMIPASRFTAAMSDTAAETGGAAAALPAAVRTCARCRQSGHDSGIRESGCWTGSVRG